MVQLFLPAVRRHDTIQCTVYMTNKACLFEGISGINCVKLLYNDRRVSFTSMAHWAA